MAATGIRNGLARKGTPVKGEIRARAKTTGKKYVDGRKKSPGATAIERATRLVSR